MGISGGGGAGANLIGSAFGLSAGSSLGTGISGFFTERITGDIQAGAAEFNAKMAELQAADELERGQTQEMRVRKQARQVIGAQRAGYSVQGVKVGEGSAAEVQADTLAQSREAEADIRRNAWRRAWGYQAEAVMQRAGGRVAKSAANQRAVSGLLTGGLDFLKTVGEGAYFASGYSSGGKSKKSGSSDNLLPPDPVYWEAP